jgi:hypothetical protein
MKVESSDRVILSRENERLGHPPVRRRLITNSTLLITATVLMGFGRPIPKQQNVTQQHPEERQQIPFPTIPAIGQLSPETEKHPSDKEPEHIWQKAFAPESWPNWGLVLVGIFASWAALKTLKTIQKQTILLINSERAWVDGEFIKRTNLGVTRYVLKITNHGKTPAEIFSYEIRSGFLNVGTEFSPTNLSNVSIQNLHVFLGSDKGEELKEFNLDEMFADEGDTTNGTQAGAICVKIRYADVVTQVRPSQDVRETSFVYYCRPLLSSLDRISIENRYS